MDTGLRSLLLDSFRRNEVPREVRLDAALGHVAPRGLEQLALLAFLVDDQDDEVRAAAEQTLTALPPAAIAATIARADTPVELVKFFATRGITPVAGAETSAVEDESPLVEAGVSTWDVIDETAAATSEERTQSVTQLLQQMNIVERVRAAMKGTREMRAILVRDPNRMVSGAVLSSPKLTAAEIEAFAKMTSVSDDVLRTIGNNRGWVKNYAVAASLAKNAKTPVAMSMNLLARLIERDVRAISIDRNVPEALRVAARKRLVSKTG